MGEGSTSLRQVSEGQAGAVGEWGGAGVFGWGQTSTRGRACLRSCGAHLPPVAASLCFSACSVGLPALVPPPTAIPTLHIPSTKQVFEEGRMEQRVPLTTRTGTKGAGEIWISLHKVRADREGAGGCGRVGGERRQQ